MRGNAAMPKTYNELYIGLRKQLRDAGVEAASLEARLLTAHAVGKTQEKLLQDLQLYASPELEKRVSAVAARRLRGEPVAYITGSWEFFGLELTVNRDVLIPRADTEVLVDKALELQKDRQAPLRILDLCTGSGCIGCALGHMLPQSHVVLADLSLKALNCARQNVRRCELGARGVCIEADATAVPPPQIGSFDMIVSNPPYIARDELVQLDGSVREYEPHMALDGGEDGLDFYRAILRHWRPLLRRGGWLLFESGETQAADVEHLMRVAGLSSIETVRDTAGLDRVVFGRE